jgi:hypothetical protein
MAETTHDVTLAVGSHLATTMIMFQESIVTVEEEGRRLKVRIWFDDDQQIVCTLDDSVLIRMTVTLRAGRQPSIKALEDVYEAENHRPIPMFKDDGPTHYDVASLSNYAVQLAGMSDLSDLLDDILFTLSGVSVGSTDPANLYDYIKLHILTECYGRTKWSDGRLSHLVLLNSFS